MDEQRYVPLQSVSEEGYGSVPQVRSVRNRGFITQTRVNLLIAFALIVGCIVFAGNALNKHNSNTDLSKNAEKNIDTGGNFGGDIEGSTKENQLSNNAIEEYSYHFEKEQVSYSLEATVEENQSNAAEVPQFVIQEYSYGIENFPVSYAVETKYDNPATLSNEFSHIVDHSNTDSYEFVAFSVSYNFEQVGMSQEDEEEIADITQSHSHAHVTHTVSSAFNQNLGVVSYEMAASASYEFEFVEMESTLSQPHASGNIFQLDSPTFDESAFSQNFGVVSYEMAVSYELELVEMESMMSQPHTSGNIFQLNSPKVDASAFNQNNGVVSYEMAASVSYEFELVETESVLSQPHISGNIFNLGSPGFDGNMVSHAFENMSYDFDLQNEVDLDVSYSF